MRIDSICEDCGDHVVIYRGRVVCSCNICDGCGNMDHDCACDGEE